MSRARNPIQPGDGDPRHGTYNGYNNLRCRCELCRAANTEYNVDRRGQRSLAPDDPRHGKWTTYFNYACRCDACRAANAAYYRGIYRRRREARAAA